MKFEERTEPFEGASGIIHPLLAESHNSKHRHTKRCCLLVASQDAGGGHDEPNTDLQAARVQVHELPDHSGDEGV